MKRASASVELTVGEAPQLEKLLAHGPNLLRFPPRLEALFQHYYLQRNRRRMLGSLALGMAFFLAFAGFDAQLLAEPAPAYRLRFGLILPVAAAVFLLLALVRRDWLAELVYALGLCLAAGVLLAISRDLAPRVEHIYLAALLLILMHAYVFAGLRVGYALLAGFLITLGAVLAMALESDFDQAMLGVWTATLAATNVMGLFACFTIETCIRQDFLRSRLLTARRLKLEDSNQLLRELAMEDELTGLANRRRFRERIREEWRRCARERKPLSLLLVDVDAFKPYNDALGHQQGDTCLRRLAEVIGNYARRPGDTAARYGGEEFAVVLTGCGLRDALNIAESLRAEIAELAIPHPDSPVADRVTVSIGLGCMTPGPEDDVEAFFETVDQALYSAKEQGRNRMLSVAAKPPARPEREQS